MNRPVNILVECPSLLPSVRLGVLEPLRPLEEKGVCKVQFKKSIQIGNKDLTWCDVLLTVRGCEFLTLKVIEAAKKANRFIVYFLDDDLLDIPMGLGSSDYFRNEKLKTILVDCLKKSDILWCVNSLVGEKYSKIASIPWILSKVPVSAIQNKAPFVSKMEKIKILYAGSTDHTRVIQKVLRPVVLKLSEEFGEEIEFLFIGANPNISQKSNVSYLPYLESYEQYKEIVNHGGFQLGLAPLGEERFYQYKYYNKFIEYTSSGIVGIYSDSPPYTLIVKHLKNGFLCKNTHDDWYQTIKLAVEQIKKGNTQLLENAASLLMTEFHREEIAENLQKDIPQLGNYFEDSLVKDKCVFFRVFIFYAWRIKLLWEKHGLLFLPVLIQKIVKKLLPIN